MKKTTLYRMFAWINFIGAFVFSYGILAYAPPSKVNLFFVCTVFTACMLGFLGFRELAKSTIKQDFTIVLLVFVFLIALIFSSCTDKSSGHRMSKREAATLINYPVIIVPSDTVDGRPTFTVTFGDSMVLDNMYSEEIGNSLKTGCWGYDEDLQIN